MGSVGTIIDNQLSQIGGPDSWAWQFKDEKLAKFQEETGYSGKQAEEAYDLIQKYFGGVKADREKMKINQLNSIINDMVKFKGTAYRGIALTPVQFSKYKDGEVIELKNVSSWSNKQSVANEWAEASTYNSGRRGDVQVVLVMDKSTQGARAGYMGIHDEGEVLYKGGTKIKVKDKKRQGNIWYINVSEVK